MGLEADSNTGVEKEQLSLERARVLWVGAGRYFDRLLPYLREAVSLGQGDNLASLVEEFDRTYEKKRRKEIGKVEKEKEVEILGGGMLRFLPEAIGESEDEVDRELLRLARRQRLTGESEVQLKVRMPIALFEEIVETPPEGSIVEYLALSEKGLEVISDLREAGVDLPDDEVKAGEEVAFSFYGWLLRKEEALPELEVVKTLRLRLYEEIGEEIERIMRLTGD